LVDLRNGFSKEYKTKTVELLARKNKIYPSMNLKTWEVDQESLPCPISEFLEDKDLAYEYMLPVVLQDI